MRVRIRTDQPKTEPAPASQTITNRICNAHFKPTRYSANSHSRVASCEFPNHGICGENSRPKVPNVLAQSTADFHANRHTFITYLSRAGVSPKLTQTLARHSTMDLTMNVYNHTTNHERRAAIEQLTSAWECAGVANGHFGAGEVINGR